MRFAIRILQVAFCVIPTLGRAEPPLAVLVGGEAFPAEFVAASDGRWLFATGTSRRELAPAELVRWGNPAESGRASGLALADGGWLAAEPLAADKESITADSATFGVVKLPLDALAGVVLRQPSDRARREMLFDRLLRDKGESDRLLLDNGDALSGIFEGMSEAAVAFQSDGGATNVEIGRVAAIFFNPALRRAAPGGDRRLGTWVGTRDGSQFWTSSFAAEGDRSSFIVAGEKLESPRSTLIYLQPTGGRAVYLSDLAPAEQHQTPFLPPALPGGKAGIGGSGLVWPHRPDRNVDGGLLRCGGRLYRKGIGVHASSRLVFNISPLPLKEGQVPPSPPPLFPKGERRPVRFAAQLGIDDSTEGGGSVVFRVFVDGQERYCSPVVRGGDAPLPVSVELGGAGRLELRVDCADRADVLDHADWLDARLENRHAQ